MVIQVFYSLSTEQRDRMGHNEINCGKRFFKKQKEKKIPKLLEKLGFVSR